MYHRSHDFEVNAIFINTAGGHSCICKGGFAEDGRGSCSCQPYFRVNQLKKGCSNLI